MNTSSSDYFGVFSRRGRHCLGLFAGILALGPAVASSATQAYPCETVLTYGTGMSDGGGKLRGGSADPNFEGVTANFPNRGEALVPTSIPTAWLADSASADSQWIAPVLDPNTADAGTYLYRLRFATPCAGGTATGRYAASDRGVLRLNGAAISFPTPAAGAGAWTSFTFNNLPVGTNTLEFYVTNTPSALGGPAGPTGLRAELNVVATCCPCIEMSCPPDIFLTTCSNGAPAFFNVTGTNLCYTNLAITCSLAAATGIPVTSGMVFPVGTNIVICTASDTVGHRTNCSFRVVVTRDSLPPEIRCPRDIVYLCGTSGTNVFFNVYAKDDTDQAPVVSCVPPSGSFFPAGTNTVLCEARDACGRVSRCSFSVIIAPNGFAKTIQAGIADDFHPSAFESTVTGPCLGGSGFWSGMPFDTSWPGRFLSHSFGGLPPNISAAKLTLHMKPTQPASQDDMLRIGLQNCGGLGVWAFAQQVASLPEASGTWNTNPPTTFALDLAALPGGINLLASLNADHRLEFAVGTETMVDYARLEVTYCGPLTTLSGVPYSLNNVYPIHQGGGGVSWRTVNSNDPPILDIDGGGADGIRFDFDFNFDLFSFCQSPGSKISKHHGLSTDWPTGEGTVATLAINASPVPGQTRITLSQPSNLIGKAVEVWNAGQLVTRRFLAGSGDTALNVPTNACLFQMGFATAYFFANFNDPISVQLLNGDHVSGQTGSIVTGDTIRMYYVITVSAPTPKFVRVTLPPGGWDVAKMSLLRDADWIEAFGPQQLTVSDVVLSKALIETLLHPYGSCSSAWGPWTLDLNGVAGFCQWDGFNLPVCNNGHLDVNITAPGNAGTILNFGGLRLTPTALPLDDCLIECTVPGAAPYSLTVNRMVGGPVTLNNISTANFSSWPLAVTGNAGPQSFGVVLPANTLVTVGAQTYTANGATFHATPMFLGEFYQVCLETTFQPQMSFKSYHTGGTNLPPDCLTLNCPTGIVADCSGLAGTPVSFSVTGATRCGSNVVVTCMPPSGSLFPPGVTVVHCTAIDSQGNRDECRFLVTVRDVTPPTLVVPARVIAPCDGPRGARVEFAAAARDDCDPHPVVECMPPSGTVFPVGTNMVTCTAVDAAGNRTSQEFPVIVSGGCGGGRCLELTLPEDIEVPCNTAGGAIVNFAASARDTCTGGAPPVVCVPPSGSLFPVGVTRVICTTTSGVTQASSAFLVEVTDLVPPQISCPSNIVVAAQSPLGAVVNYAVTATDDCTPQPRVRCSPPGGSVFPVGDTRVMCEASDGSGNVTRCIFVITVLPPRPMAATARGANRVELRWIGDALVESADALSDATEWSRIAGTPISNGVERSLEVPVDPGQKFFRIVPLPLLPPMDHDRDGVPDERDRCPDTPAGLVVDEFGCSPFDLVASPDLALGPEQALLRKIRSGIVRWPSVAGLLDRIPNPDVHTCSVPALIITRELPQALVEQSNVVRKLDIALMDFIRARALRLIEIERAAPTFDAENADVRNEDHEMMDLEQLEQELTDGLNQHQRAFLNLSNIVRSTGNVIPRQRVQIQSIDSARGFAVLTDGRQLLLPNPGTTGAPPLDSILDAIEAGSEVNADISPLPDGSIYGNLVSSTVGVSSEALQLLNPRRLDLRVTPVDFGLPDFDLAPRHRLKAYKWGFTENLSHHYFEFGQAFVAVPFLSSVPGGSYKHWLKIDADADNNGTYSTLVQKLDQTTKPFVLKANALPEYTAFNIRIREYRAPVLAGGGLGQSEVIHEEVQVIELNRVGIYAEAYYDKTAFDLADSPSETGHGVARVNDISRRFPLTLKPLNEMSFSGASYKATGNSSSYPGVQSIGFNDPFAVHFEDPNSGLFFANPDDFDKGIYGPRLKGYNHNKEFHYRVKLPFIARDRLHNCTGEPDTFYKIPFSGLYSVSQGNNGTFTHNGWQRFAWDFPKSAGTTVLAARGGRVVDMRESSSQSCWNSNAQACQNCTGAASPNFVKVRHRDGTEAWYGHFQNNGVLVNLNQRVYRGTAFGKVGTTGCSTGNHLHLHVVDPDQTTTVPLRFEAYTLPFVGFDGCYLPPSNSTGISTQ